MTMMQNTGYSSANPQTPFAVLGCFLALVGMALAVGLLFSMATVT